MHRRGMVNGSPVDGTEGEISHAHATVPIITRKKPPLYSPSPSPTAPSQHYKNVPHSPAPSAPSSMVPAGASTVTSVELQNTTTLVRVTYIPQLPDELAITLGEKLQICIEFDDGWALCDNMRGERGMVPLECLEGGDGQFKGLPSVVDWRNSRRTSSLRSVRG
ncbi:hypothetical protein B0F90DRAFT_798490 [Multifurca ochricompacta]|uniref:SH3 domain-containing protein n=1 Tax=Multifurca ochricompacta TaxID=376703 RepID=A0AAD4MAC0_9AGAM|nr:hypothetical protein B0F90DRAFT_798490 [Multifurca ochricompacta]